jgi:hypothetical protein
MLTPSRQPCAWTCVSVSPARVCRRRSALRAMHSPAGAAVAGSGLAASSGARRSVARSQRSPVARPFTLSSTTTQGRPRRHCALPVRLRPTEVPAGQRCWRTAIADHGTYRETGGAHACLTRRWRGLANRVGAACPHTPRRSLRSAVGRMVFYWPGCGRPGTGGRRVLLPLTARRGGGAP